MSNKTQLQTNNTNLDALISRVNAAKDTAASLPEADGTGGAVETCTVTINTLAPLNIYGCTATILESGKPSIQTPIDGANYTHTVTINNVIKGSIIAIQTNAPIVPVAEFSDSTIYNVNSKGQTSGIWTFAIPPFASDNIVIDVYDDD